MLSKPRANWKSVKYVTEYYDLSPQHCYNLAKLPNFPCMKIGKRGIRIDMSRIDKWFEDYFRR